tara:strand:+ start:625 stop:1632 length:1008 start_codon:yes stop_codon:yes gene_type:complete
MRPRKNTKLSWLPPRVYQGKSAYEYRPKSGGAIRLGSLKAKKWEIIKAYEEYIASLEDSKTVSGLISDYFESAEFDEKSENTKKDYKKASKKIIAVFGKADPNRLTPPHIRKYLDKRGISSRTQANREVAFFSRVCNWGIERARLKINPCKGVKKFKEVARDRYIEDWEYNAVYKNVPSHVQIAMEISYLCAARKGDVLSMTWKQVLDEGVFIQQGKTGTKQIKEWSPRLRKALRQAKTLSKGNVFSQWVICQPNGKRFTDRGFDEGWMKGREAARKQTEMPLDFTFHDIKAKSISDYEGTRGEKRNFSGHKTESQVDSYDRKVPIVPTIGSKNS